MIVLMKEQVKLVPYFKSWQSFGYNKENILNLLFL